MFSKTKRPLKRAASTIQALFRHYWRLFLDTESRSRSWFETTILPIWTLSVSIVHFVQRMFRSPAKESGINERTPLIGEDVSDSVSGSSSDSVRSPPVCVRSGVPVRPLDIRVNSFLDTSRRSIEPETFYYSVDPYCVLCRKTFHGSFCNSFEGDDGFKWDHHFIASK